MERVIHAGLPGSRSPWQRIFAAVDVWDALRHDRPYRPAWPQQQVRDHLRGSGGNHLDPRVVNTFLDFLAAADAATTGPP